MARKGEYRKWVTGEGLDMVCQWARLGLSDKQIASNIGVSTQTFYDWLKRFPEFSDAIKKAKYVPEIELENAMFNLATGKMYIEEIKSILDPNTGKVLRIEKTRKQLPPNPTIQIFLAKNKMPDRYKDRLPVAEDSNNAIDDVVIYLPEKESAK